ncbi:DUF2490 domain-containing protein [Bacteroides sp.]|uniref:DUF2490 domain-containing protein n=1 Tax=Bacteroides sp. TaxID=29523 RepID=UPI003AB388C3
MTLRNTVNGSRFYFLLIVLISLSQQSLRAQDGELATWANVGAKYEVAPAFAVIGGLEWRTMDNLGRTDRLGLEVGGIYTVLPFLKFGAGYEMHYRNRVDAGWKLRHRYYIDGTVSTQVQQVKLSLRERFQSNVAGDKDKLRLRSRLTLAYELRNSKIEPYVSVEMYNSLARAEHFDVKRMRYRGGIALPLSSRWDADVFYCWQSAKGDDRNIVGIECNYKF